MQSEAHPGPRLNLEQFEALHRPLPFPSGVFTIDGTIVAANEAALQLSQLPREQVVGRPFWKSPYWAGNAEDQARVLAAIASAAAGARASVEYPAGVGGRQLRHIHLSLARLEYTDHPVPLVVSAGMDITDRAQLEERLLVHTDLLEQAQRIGRLGTLEWNLNTDQFVMSDISKEIFGFPSDFEPSLADLAARLEPADLERLRHRVERAMAGEAGIDLEHVVVRPDGGRRWVRSIAEMRQVDADRPRHLLGTLLDITDLKQAAVATEQALATRREAQRLAHLGFWEVDLATGAFQVCEELAGILELDPAAPRLKRDDLPDLLHPDDREAAGRIYAESIAAGTEYELVHRIQTRGGRVKHVYHKGRSFYDASGRPVRSAGIIQDITARVLAEQETRDAVALLNTVMDASPDWIFLKDADYRYVYVNRAFADSFGLAKADVIGRVDSEFVLNQSMIPAPVEVYRQADRRALAGETVHLPDQSLTMRNGSVRINDTLKLPVRRSAAGGTEILTLARDVSDRRRIEEALVEAKTELEARVKARTERLEALNTELEAFSYTVSHDLKTPLRAIDGYSRLLLDSPSLSADAEARDFLQAIRQAASRMNAIVNDLLDYSRVEHADAVTRAVDVAGLVGSVLSEFGEETRQRAIDVRVTLPFAEAVVAGEGLTIALRNVIGNAVKFLGSAPEPRIEIGGREEAAGWMLWVKDNGIGFDMRFHDRLFQLFQRLHHSEAYEGTGVGLAVSRKVMARMGGRIWAESAPGEGATFFLSWPR